MALYEVFLIHEWFFLPVKVYGKQKHLLTINGQGRAERSWGWVGHERTLEYMNLVTMRVLFAYKNRSCAQSWGCLSPLIPQPLIPQPLIPQSLIPNLSSPTSHPPAPHSQLLTPSSLPPAPQPQLLNPSSSTPAPQPLAPHPQLLIPPALHLHLLSPPSSAIPDVVRLSCLFCSEAVLATVSRLTLISTSNL